VRSQALSPKSLKPFYRGLKIVVAVRLSFTIRKTSVRHIPSHVVMLMLGTGVRILLLSAIHGRPPTTNLQPLSIPRATTEKRSADDQCLIWDVRDNLRPRRFHDTNTRLKVVVTHTERPRLSLLQPSQHRAKSTLALAPKMGCCGQVKGLPSSTKNSSHSHFASAIFFTLATTIMRTFTPGVPSWIFQLHFVGRGWTCSIRAHMYTLR
jgi:hypothetical protein